MPQDNSTSNPSMNRSIDDVIAARLSRRSLLGGGVGAAALVGVGALSGCVPENPAGPGAPSSTTPTTVVPTEPLLGFESVSASSADRMVVADGYVAEVMLPWGQPILSDGPSWKADGSNTAAEQAQQIGFNHDGIHYFPLNAEEGNRKGLLAMNHEYTDATQIYAEAPNPITAEHVAKALAAHGVSVVQVEMRNNKWRLVDSQYNRRITGSTPMTMSGPVTAAHPKISSSFPIEGTLNNCGNGATPWGTYLTAEENWNQYFGTENADFVVPPEAVRYGVPKNNSLKWHQANQRFDLATNPNEINRFGWIVEIDPFDPQSIPVKRTALGRFKHEGAAFAESAGVAVLYSGDDENGEYIYKFVGNAPWRDLRAASKSPLDEGDLFVAKFNDDGTGEWLPLVHGVGALTVANGWADQAEISIRTRAAADAVGATKMHRPEWIAVSPLDGTVFCTLTNGSGNVNAANPRPANPYGSIMSWKENDGDFRSLAFSWDVFAFCGDPAYPALTSAPGDIVGDLYGSPDGIAVDADGRIFIQTDISNSSQNLASKGYDNIGNNQMLIADPFTRETRRFFVGPRGCEVTGVAMTPDQQTLFINIQHPGESTPAFGAPTNANPRAVSNWPDYDPNGRPRPATVVIRKIGGGKIGS